jgi:ATP-dependent Clp protease ATP-binding subunit ClpC
MFRRFTQRARNAVIHAQEEARQLNHPAIGTEHILLGVLREGEGVGAKALMSMGTDLEKVRAEVTKLIGERGDSPQAAVGDLPITPGAKKVFNLSFEEARLQGVNYVGTEHLLLAILHEKDGVAGQVLLSMGVKLDDLREQVLIMMGGDAPSAYDNHHLGDNQQETGGGRPNQAETA